MAERLTRSRSPKKEYVDDVPYAAARVAFAGRESDALFAHEGLETVGSAVFYFERANGLKGLVRQVARLVWEDFRGLEAAARDGRWKSTTPVTGDVLGPVWPEGPPKGWPAHTPKRARTKPMARPKLKDLRLPKDLVAFLAAGQRLKYRASGTEVGPIQLKPLDHLKLTNFEVEDEDTPARKKSLKRRRARCYRVRAVDLVAECDAYGPEGILAWLPDYQSFGQWDPDHLRLLIFPGVTWSQIVKDPARYLDAQWGDFEEFARYLAPGEHGKPTRGKP